MKPLGMSWSQRFINLIGKRFGKLLVIKRLENDKQGQSMWECRCDCGSVVIKSGAHLRRGYVKSCGCLRKIDNKKNLIGKRFGRLLVTEYAGLDTYGRALWKCLCNCGTECILPRGSLVNAMTKSCGCYLEDSRKLKEGEAVYNRILSEYKTSAKSRGYEFSLEEEEFSDLINSDCYYCGKPPSQKRVSASNNGDIIYNGIDRVDNSIGYVHGNVVPCCIQCNRAKMTYSLDDFKHWLKTAYEHLDLGALKI